MSKVTLAQAEGIIDAALAKGHEMGFEPLSVAVLDDGGNLVAFKKEDNSSLLRFDIARGKAWGALGMGISSRALEERAQNRPGFFYGLLAASDGRLILGAGGVLIKNDEGVTLGAVGISGDTSDNDEICSLAGIEAVGLKPS